MKLPVDWNDIPIATLTRNSDKNAPIAIQRKDSQNIKDCSFSLNYRMPQVVNSDSLVSQQLICELDDKELECARAQHRVNVQGYEDLNSKIRFQWHFPVGTFDPRMSGWEIADFLLGHFPYVLPFMSPYPRVYSEFQAMMHMIILSPRDVIDRVLSWIKPVLDPAKELDDLIVLELFAEPEEYKYPKHFDCGALQSTSSPGNVLVFDTFFA